MEKIDYKYRKLLLDLNFLQYCRHSNVNGKQKSTIVFGLQYLTEKTIKGRLSNIIQNNLTAPKSNCKAKLVFSISVTYVLFYKYQKQKSLAQLRACKTKILVTQYLKILVWFQKCHTIMRKLFLTFLAMRLVMMKNVCSEKV